MNANAITTAPNIRDTRQSLRRTISPSAFAVVTLMGLIASAVAIAALAQWTDIDLWLADLDIRDWDVALASSLIYLGKGRISTKGSERFFCHGV